MCFGNALTSKDDTVTVLPIDEHNETLVSHVHPPDWTNPTPDGRYNLVVIGAGTAGLYRCPNHETVRPSRGD